MYHVLARVHFNACFYFRALGLERSESTTVLAFSLILRALKILMQHEKRDLEGLTSAIGGEELVQVPHATEKDGE